MKTRIIRTLIGTAAIVAMFASPATAATTKVTDARGDGNPINRCIFGGLLSDVCVPPLEPASTPGLDITSITWTTKKVNRRPVALIVAMTFAGKPNINENHYQAFFSLGGDACAANPAIESWSTEAYVRICPNGLDEKIVKIARPKVTTNQVIFTIPTSALSQVRVSKGTALRELGGHTGPMLSSPEMPVFGGTIGATPYYDDAYSTKSYVFGR